MLSADDPLIEAAQRLRADRAFAVLEGFHALKHALRFGADIVLVLAADPAGLDALARRLAPDVGAEIAARVRPATAQAIATLSPHAPRTGVIAFARRPRDGGPGARGTNPGRPLILLEDPRHLGNVGAVIRVAAAAGAAGVLTTGPSDPWSAAALRGSAGLHFALPVGRVAAVPDDPDRPLIAVDPAGEPLATRALPPGATLAFGTERDGLSDAVIARASARVAIPMRAGVSSLNLATAVAVMLYSLSGPGSGRAGLG
ncbi:MAG TPA: TrmH family RNA methyltransferase [Solirubrobacteraceae bacterium]|nr:TrmH family RNA methyltransferase [Solirubrobacteraceae bacterium]